MLLQGRLHGAESVSAELFAAALQLAANRDLVDPGRDEVRAARDGVPATRSQDVVGASCGSASWTTARLEEVLDDDAR